MVRVYRKLLHAVDNHGLRGLLVRAASKLKRSDTSVASHGKPDELHPFDVAHNVDTSGYVPGDALTPSDLYNTAYYGISPSTLTRALERLPEPLHNFSFVDLGCGKGRALLVASQFPFLQILGVELAADLVPIAEANTASDPRIEIRLQNALTVAYPDAPLVVYLYHPFLSPQLRLVLANLHRQRRDSAHATYLLYANCSYFKLMSRLKFLRQVWDHSIALSREDAAADRHGITHERFTLYRLV